VKSKSKSVWPAWQPILVLTLLSLGIAAAGFLYYEHQLVRFREDKEAELQIIAESKAGQIALWRRERYSDAHFIFHFAPLTQQVSDLESASESGPGGNKALEWMTSMYGNGHYSRMMILDRDHRLLTTVPAGTVTLDSASQELIRKAASSGEIEVSDLFLAGNGQPCLEIVVPVVSLTRGDRCPCVLLQIDPNKELYPLVQSWPVRARTYECALVRLEDQQVVYLNELRHTDIIPVKFRRPLAPQGIPTLAQMQAGRGMAYGEDYRGIRVTAAIERVPDSPWILISKLDDAELNSPVRERAWLVSILVLAVIIASGVVIVLLWRRQQALAERARAEAETRERLLQASHDSLFRHGYDIILLLDKTGRIVDCNDRAVRAYQYDRAVLIGMDVSRLRADGTIPVSDLVAKVMGEPSDSGLVYESRHVRKDGTEFPIEVSLRRISTDHSDLGVAVVRDITERKRAEEVLFESQRRLSTLMGNLPGMAYRCRNDREWTMEFVSEGCRELTGYGPEDLVDNKTLAFNDLIEEEFQETLWNQWQEVLAEHRHFHGEYPIIAADGKSKWVWEQGCGVYTPDGEVIALEGLIVDITDRVIAQRKLAEAATYWTITFNALSDGVFILDEQGTVLRCNDSLSAILGLPKEQIIGRKCHGLMHDLDVFYPNCPFAQLLTGVLGKSMECPIRGRWYVSTVDPILDDEGKVTGAVHVLRDITQHKLAEEALRESENRTRSIIDAVPIGMHMYRLEADDRLVFIGANPAADRILNLNHSQFVGRTIEDAFPPLQETELPSRYRQAAAAGQSWQTEHIEYRDGAIEGAFEVHAFRTAPNHMVAAFEDITERKRAELSLLAKTEELDRFFSVNLDLLCIADTDGYFRKVNRAVEATLGYSAQELEGTSFLELVHPDDLESTLAVVSELESGQDVVDFVNRFHSKDGSYRWIEWRSTPFAGNLIFAAARDITERKNIETALQATNMRLLRAQRIAKMGFLTWNLKTNDMHWSDELYHLYGIDPRVQQASLDLTVSLIHPDDTELAKRSLDRAIEGVSELDVDHRMVRPDGREIWVHAQGELIKDPDGTPSYFVGTHIDITERKQTEAVLRHSEELYRTLFEQMLNGFAHCRIVKENGRPTDFIYLNVNPAFEALTGLKNVEGRRASEVIPGIQNTDLQLIETYGRVAETGVPERFEFYLEALDMWFSLSVYSSEKEHFVAVFDVITDRKRAEYALRESEERFRRIFEEGPMGMVMSGKDFRFTAANDAFADMIGYSPAELVSMTFAEITHSDHLMADAAAIRRLFAGEIPIYRTEKKYVRKDGEIVWGATTVTVVSRPDGEFLYFLAMIDDITDRTRALEALRASELRFRTLIEDSPVAMGIAIDGVTMYGNPRCLEMFGAKALDEMSGRTELDWLAPSEHAAEAERIRRRKLGLPVENSYECLGLRTDGTEFPFHVAVTQVNLNDGPASVAVFTDLTMRKKAEQELRNSHEQLRQLTAHIESVREDERRWVAREVHDEIGQFLTALKMDIAWIRKRLRIDQAVLKVKSEEMGSLVDSAVQSVKKISAHMRPVPLEDLGFEAALDWLVEDFEKRTEIKCGRTLRICTADLDAERSTALFRILQETLNNVARHSKATEVTLELVERSGQAVLSVRDNGVGIDPSRIAGTRSFGLVGMRERARYLGGNISVGPAPEGGTLVVATIPITEEGISHD
jgi:PAS domain S-box-containing protein